MPPPDKTRPVILVSRDDAYARRQYAIVAPITRGIRGIAAEVHLGRPEGLPAASVANCDSLDTISKKALVRRAAGMSEARLLELDGALRFALGLD